MVCYEKTKSFTRSEAWISSGSEEEKNLEGHPAAKGVYFSFGPQSYQGSSYALSSIL